MGSTQRIVSMGALALSLAAWAGQAQAQDHEVVVDHGLGLHVQGGGYSSLAHLDDSETVDFKTGFNMGGGLAYQFNRYFALRGNFTFARAEARANDVSIATPIAGTKFDRFIYDGDLQFRYPFRIGIAPYVFAGGGGITTKQHDTQNSDSFTKGAGKFGAGVSYQVPKSRVGLYLEAATWAYKWNQYGFDKTQFDLSWSGGIAYAF